MKLASFLYQGKRSYGIVQAEGVIDLGRRLGDRYGDLKALLQGNGLAQATRFLNDAVDVPLNAITFLPVIVQPEKILCVGMNYADKRKEFDQHNPAPTLFVRFPDSQTGHNEPVLKPRHSSEFDYEGETVMMAPAAGFYTTPGVGRNEVRIAYVLKKEDLERALIVLRKALEAYPGRVVANE